MKAYLVPGSEFAQRNRFQAYVVGPGGRTIAGASQTMDQARAYVAMRKTRMVPGYTIEIVDLKTGRRYL